MKYVISLIIISLSFISIVKAEDDTSERREKRMTDSPYYLGINNDDFKRFFSKTYELLKAKAESNNKEAKEYLDMFKKFFRNNEDIYTCGYDPEHNLLEFLNAKISDIECCGFGTAGPFTEDLIDFYVLFDSNGLNGSTKNNDFNPFEAYGDEKSFKLMKYIKSYGSGAICKLYRDLEYDKKITIEGESFSFDDYVRLAQLGYSNAQHNLGVYYYNESFDGRSNAKKKIEYKKLALYWLKKAAKQNFLPSQFMLGIIYFRDYSLKNNYQKAIHWFKKATMSHYLYSDYDSRDGIQLRERAAVLAGLIYEYHFHNYKEAERMYNVSESESYCPCCNGAQAFFRMKHKNDFRNFVSCEDTESFEDYFAYVYLQGANGVKQSYKKAFDIFEKIGSYEGFSQYVINKFHCIVKRSKVMTALLLALNLKEIKKAPEEIFNKLCEANHIDFGRTDISVDCNWCDKDFYYAESTKPECVALLKKLKAEGN